MTFIVLIPRKTNLETAAKLIKDDIKAVKTSHCNYPGIDELGSDESINFLPTSLRVLLTNLFVEKMYRQKLPQLDRL